MRTNEWEDGRAGAFPASVVAQATVLLLTGRRMARASLLPVGSAASGTSVGNVVGARVGGLVSPTFVGAAAPAETIVCECRAVDIRVLSEVLKSAQCKSRAHVPA